MLNYFQSTKGTPPFTDGFVWTFIWRINEGHQYATQIALEDGLSDMRIRHLNGNIGSTWAAWKKFTIT